MLKFITIFCYAILAYNLATGSAIPAAPERAGGRLPSTQETSPGFSPEQMSQLSDICFTTLRLMLDQTSPIQQRNNSSRSIKLEEKVSPKKIISQDVEQIGSRFFYIEKEHKMTWFQAEMSCRQMGGQLATIQDKEELKAISKFLQSESYWLDLSDLGTPGLFVSWSSGKAAPFLRWDPNQTDEDLDQEHCVNLYESYMFHEKCESNYYLFICQAI